MQFPEGLGYEAAFYSLPDPVFIYNHSHRKIILSNEAAVKRYGFSEEEFKTMGPWDIESPFDQAELVRRIDELKEVGSVVYRTEHRAANGETFPVEMHTIYRFLNDQDIFVAISRELTERLESERRLEKAESHYRAIFENSNSLICVADLKTGYYIDVNPAFEAALGYSRKKLLSTPLLEFIHPDDLDNSKQLVSTLLRDGRENTSFQNRLRHKDGHYIWLDWSTSHLADKGVVYSSALNITQRKWFEEKLRIQNQRMRLHVEQTPLGVIEWGLDFRITAWNHAATQIFGYTSEEAIGQSGIIILPEGLRGDVKITWEKLASNTGGKHFVNENVHKDGSKLLCEWHNTTLVDKQGEVVGVASLVLDVTESEKRKEDLQRARDAAEKANRAKSEFLAMMSHELRTPLNSIIGPCELLKLQSNDPETTPLIEVMLTSSAHLLELINSILDLSKIESGNLEPEFETLDIDFFFKKRVLPLATSAEKKGLEYHFQNKTPPRSVLRTDGRLLLQVLFNIIGNSIKFTDQGSVTVSVEPVKNLIRIIISDTGIGIPDSQKQSLFNPFSKGNLSLSHKQEGSGLGLSISKRIVDLLGGRIEFESEVGTGTTFVVTLPGLENGDETGDKKDRELDTDSEKSQRDSKILLVEDEPNNQLVTAAILNHLKYNHEIATSGEEAIELWKEGRHPIVLMDVKLPQIDGIEATRKIRELAGDNPVWIIAQSAYALAEQKREFLASGMDDYISKPISIPELVSCLEKAKSELAI